MAYKAFVQQFTKHILSADAEVGTKAVGEQKRRAGRHIAGDSIESRFPLEKPYRGKVTHTLLLGAILLAPVIVRGITCTYLLQVQLQRQTTRLVI